MKKILLVAALVLGFTTAAVAQPRAIGLRGGYGVEVSYQHTLGANFVEADLGLVGTGLNAAALYNWNIVQFGNGFNVYAGPGASLGFWKGYFHVGVAGQVGIEYSFKPQFNVPIQLSIDVRPEFGVGIVSGVGAGFHAGGYWPSLGIRYEF